MVTKLLMAIPYVQMSVVWLFTLFFNFFFIYSTDGTDVYGSRGCEFEEIWSVWVVDSCKIMFLVVTSYSLFQILAVGCIV